MSQCHEFRSVRVGKMETNHGPETFVLLKAHL